jgi:hypothetical protein
MRPYIPPIDKPFDVLAENSDEYYKDEAQISGVEIYSANRNL